MIRIENGTVVDPARGLFEPRDLLIEEGRITAVARPGQLPEMPGAQRVDARGKWVVPGLVDMHVHLREPGHEYKETVASGALAAVAGGFSAVACMPNTDPPNDCSSVTEFILGRAKEAGLCHVYPVAAITVERKGVRLTEFGDLKRAGALALSDDGSPVVNSELMRRALEYAHYHGLIVISHCEDPTLSQGGAMHEGEVSTRIGLPGIPAAAEEIMVHREIALARMTRCPVHVAHVSTAGSVALLRRAKEEGLPVTAETAPHYFTLDHRAVEGYNTSTKVAPPLRTPEDVQAVRDALAEGVIDVIATDHAPHSPLEKAVEFDQAAPGMIGLETAVPLTLALVRQGILGVVEAIEKLSLAPARILGVQGGSLQEGAAADLALIDPEEEFVLSEQEILSKSKNTPFLGKRLKGRNWMTLVGGRIVWQRDA